MLLRRYIEIPLIIIAALMIAMLVTAPVAQAKEPALVILQAPAGSKLKPTPIRDRVGKFPSPVAGKPQSSWILTPGDARKSSVSPPNRVVQLYHTVDKKPALLCTLTVQYSPHNGKWIPAYRIEERVVLMRDGKRVKPLPSGAGEIDLVVMTNSSLPDVNGFYSRLEFSLPSRRVAIDAWEVR